MRRIAWSMVLCLTLAASACDRQPPPNASSGPVSPQSGLPTGILILGTGSSPPVLSVEIAQTDTERHLGLMGRSGLAPDTGMVFLPLGPSQEGFWMKNTFIPLSIAFWDAQGTIVDILDMQPCHADPCPLYTPQSTYVGAVEANLGYFERNGINVGDPVELTR